MKIIKQIFQKLFSIVNNSKKTTNINNDNEYIGAITFKITSNKDIDILYSLPNIMNKSVSDISDLSEIYAEFLLYINEGYLKNDIIESLKKNATSQPDADPNYHLLIDNIIFNWAMIHVSKREKRLEKSNQPVIRPIAVFNPI